MAASLFALKMGVALGGALTGWVLGYYNFQANEVQTDETIYGIIFLIGVVAAVIGVLGALLMTFYPLDGDKMEEIEIELEARRGELDTATPTT